MRDRVLVVDEVQPAAVADYPVLLLKPHGGTHRAADGDTDAVRIECAQLDTAVGDSSPRRDHGELRGPVHAPDLLRAQAMLLMIEVNLCGYPGAEGGGLKERNCPRRCAAFAQQPPEVRGADSSRGQDLDARYDDSPARHA